MTWVAAMTRFGARVAVGSPVRQLVGRLGSGCWLRGRVVRLLLVLVVLYALA